MGASLFTRPFLLLLTQFLAVSTVVAFFFPLQEYLKLLGFPAASAGFILGADALAALVVQFLITPLVTAKTARYWLLGGSIVLALALFLEGSLTGELGFTTARLLQGAGFVCVVAALMPLFVLCIPRDMSGRAFGMISLVRLVPYAAVPPLFDLLGIMPSALGSVIRWAALLALLAGVLLWWLPRFPQEQEESPGSSFAGVRESLTDRNLLLLFGATVLLYAGYALVFFFLKGFGREQGISSVGLFFTAATVVMMVARLFGGRLFDRYDKRRLNAVSLALSAGAVVLLPLLAHSGGLLLLALLCGLGWGVSMPLLNALIFDLSQAGRQGLNQNLSLLMLQAGFFLGPLLGGLAQADGGYRLVFTVAGGFLMAAAGAVLLVKKVAVKTA